MENQPKILDKAVKISIIAGVLIVALSIAYYLVVFLPNKEATMVEQQEQARLDDDQKEKEKETKQLIRDDVLRQEVVLRKQQQQEYQDNCVLAAVALAEKQAKSVDDYNNNCGNYKGTLAIDCYNKSGEMASDISKKLNQDKQLCYQRFPVE